VVGVVPYWKTLGLELTSIGDGRAEFRLSFRRAHLQNGVMHGGVLASLVDSACACAAISLTYPKSYAATISLEVRYMRPVTGGRLTAQARCVRAGRTVCFSECRVVDGEGTLVALGSSQLARIPLPPPRRPRRRG
jgi:uncharacterized protein (TIGR00369 family)